MAGRHRGPMIRRATKREMVWFFWDIDATAIAADANVVLGSLNAAALALRPFTVVRTHLLVNWQSDQTAASETPTGALGSAVTSEQAATQSVVPNPMANADSSAFFTWTPLISPFVFGSAAAFIEPGGYMKEVDSKAMRKVGPNEQIRVICENTSPTAGAIITVVGRQLVKLH